jgi:hypothetical protein
VAAVVLCKAKRRKVRHHHNRHALSYSWQIGRARLT